MEQGAIFHSWTSTLRWQVVWSGKCLRVQMRF